MPCLSEATVIGWLDGHLSQEDRREAQAHTLECPSCLELIAASRLLRSSAPDEASYLCPNAQRDQDDGHHRISSRRLSTAAPELDLAMENPPNPDQRYQLGSEIGAGGMGRVFESQDLALGRSVAIKMVRNPSPALVARFRSEVAIASMLQHPSIIPVYDAGTFSEGSAFCVMRLVKGDSLAQAIDARKTVAARIGLVPAIIQAADAIAYAHSRDIIHRDLKPPNILLGQFGETVVLDWGLAKKLGDKNETLQAAADSLPGVTEHGQVLGTRGYMAPEQEQGRPADKRSDVFALGMILKQIIFGVLPSAATSISLRKVPKDLVAICERATQSDPNKRYTDGQEFADDLKRFETGQLVSAQTYSTLTLFVRWALLHRAYVTAMAIIAALITGAIITGSLISEAERKGKSSVKEAPETYLMKQLVGMVDGTTREKKLDEQRAIAESKEGLAVGNSKNIESQQELAQSYVNLGDTLFYVLVGENDREGALTQYRKALSIHKTLAAANPSQVDLRVNVSKGHQKIGAVFYEEDQLQEALNEYELAMEVIVPGSSRDNKLASRTDVSILQKMVARIQHELGNDEAALVFYRALLAHRQNAAESSPRNADRQQDLSWVHGKVAEVLLSLGKPAEAREHYQASIAVAQGVGYVEDRWRRVLALNELALGRILSSEGQADAAIRAFAKCASLYQDFGYSSADDEFDAACCSALAGDIDGAFRALNKALSGNWHNTLSIAMHPDLASLRGDQRWRSLLAKMHAKRLN